MTYRFWGKWDEPLFAGSFWVHYYQGSIYKQLGLIQLEGKMMFLGANYYQWIEDWTPIEEMVRKQLEKKDTSFLEKAFRLIQTIINHHEELGKKIREINLRKLSQKEIALLLGEFIQSSQEMVACWVLVFQFEPGIENFLKDKAGKLGIPFTDIFALITPPREVLLVQQEKLFQEIKSEIDHLLPQIPTRNRVKFLQKEVPHIYEKIEHYLREFSWVGTHSYRGEGITEESLFNRLREKNKGVSKKEKPKLGIPAEIEQAVRVGSELCYYRLQIAEYYDKVAYAYRPFLTTIAHGMEINYDDILWYTYNELAAAIQKGPANKPELEERKRLSGVVIEKERERVLIGKECAAEIAKYEEKITQTDTVKGLIAFKGKVSGRVKLLAVPQDIAKVQEGDIIIAPETTPDFIAAMRKAAAFVTDIGGITSHAAIVARELKKPCIVGTKIATRLFKDGDMVEVDAERGIIRRVGK